MRQSLKVKLRFQIFPTYLLVLSEEGADSDQPGQSRRGQAKEDRQQQAGVRHHVLCLI